MENTIRRSEIMPLLNTRPTAIFGLEYIKADGTLRRASCKLHVDHPGHGTKPGRGFYKGESAKEALENHGNLKYYDMGKQNPDGTQGAYRTAKMSRIQKLVFDKVSYMIVD